MCQKRSWITFWWSHFSQLRRLSIHFSLAFLKENKNRFQLTKDIRHWSSLSRRYRHYFHLFVICVVLSCSMTFLVGLSHRFNYCEFRTSLFISGFGHLRRYNTNNNNSNNEQHHILWWLSQGSVVATEPGPTLLRTYAVYIVFLVSAQLSLLTPF